MRACSSFARAACFWRKRHASRTMSSIPGRRGAQLILANMRKVMGLEAGRKKAAALRKPAARKAKKKR